MFAFDIIKCQFVLRIDPASSSRLDAVFYDVGLLVHFYNMNTIFIYIFVQRFVPVCVCVCVESVQFDLQSLEKNYVYNSRIFNI